MYQTQMTYKKNIHAISLSCNVAKTWFLEGQLIRHSLSSLLFHMSFFINSLKCPFPLACSLGALVLQCEFLIRLTP